MQDNPRPHVVRCVINYLQEVKIQHMEWPAMSPDWNPIEHVWDELGRRVRDRPARPEMLQKLKVALREEWENIDQNVIRNLTHAPKNFYIVECSKRQYALLI